MLENETILEDIEGGVLIDEEIQDDEDEIDDEHLY